ncbi:MAG: PilN domain-containing protein [Rubrivivax sp.]|nr:PilN domain-containing protein [Rubrivivax sp.]
MAQQINLFSPILLTPKRHFSAAAMLQALGACALALALLCGWSLWRTQALQRDLAATAPLHDSELARLRTALAALPDTSKDVQALEQEAAAAEQALAERQRLLTALGGDAAAGRSPAALLRQLALTLPAPVWLTDVKLTGQRLELSGQTLQPEALQAWLKDWTDASGTPARQPDELVVQRQPDGSPGGGESWAFRVVRNGASNGGLR